MKKEEKKSVKDEKKKEKPKKEEAEEMDAADEALLEEPKSKDPFDEMPKGTFNMDDFKRFYSNNEESKSIPYFWDKFDKENYSIWFGEYKYSDELTKVFMSCNLISGKFCYYVFFLHLLNVFKQACINVWIKWENNALRPCVCLEKTMTVPFQEFGFGVVKI